MFWFGFLALQQHIFPSVITLLLIYNFRCFFSVSKTRSIDIFGVVIFCTKVKTKTKTFTAVPQTPDNNTCCVRRHSWKVTALPSLQALIITEISVTRSSSASETLFVYIYVADQVHCVKKLEMSASNQLNNCSTVTRRANKYLKN